MIRSRKMQQHRVDIPGVRTGEVLKLTIRALRPAIEAHLRTITGFSIDAETRKVEGDAEAWANGYVRFGVVAIHDAPLDPDTGQPFALVFEKARIDGLEFDVLTGECAEGLADYMQGILASVLAASRLTNEEKAGIPFISSPEASPAST